MPTFPNARYLMSRVDYAYFDGLHRSNPAQPVIRGAFADSVLPIMEHGRAVLVDPGAAMDTDLTDQIWLESAAGHSPGNLNVFLKSGGRNACFCGDVMHHAIQCAAPHLSNPADYDREQAVAARRALLHRCADTDMVVLTGHFPDPTVGRIISRGDAFGFRFEE
ncbi:MAG: hypothetical protein WDN49_01050 [Acetobacteraceae bacterium]